MINSWIGNYIDNELISISKKVFKEPKNECRDEHVGSSAISNRNSIQFNRNWREIEKNWIKIWNWRQGEREHRLWLDDGGAVRKKATERAEQLPSLSTWCALFWWPVTSSPVTSSPVTSSASSGCERWGDDTDGRLVLLLLLLLLFSINHVSDEE